MVPRCVGSDSHNSSFQIVVGSGRFFSFDYVFPPSTTQEQIHDDCVVPLVDGARDLYYQEFAVIKDFAC